jgi:5-hydroxyisourate hydrolase-like protein (transthyretin family)
MSPYNTIIQTYCLALKLNDYPTLIKLFSKDAYVCSFFAGQKPAPEFFHNLFKTSKRTKVELKNIFIGENNTIAAYIHLESIWNEKYTIQFEAVDIFEFNAEHKIKTLKIILDTYPLRKLQEKP